MADESWKLDLTKATTCDLVAELRGRKGVEFINIEPHAITHLPFEGPVIILKVTD